MAREPYARIIPPTKEYPSKRLQCGTGVGAGDGDGLGLGVGAGVGAGVGDGATVVVVVLSGVMVVLVVVVFGARVVVVVLSGTGVGVGACVVVVFLSSGATVVDVVGASVVVVVLGVGSVGTTAVVLSGITGSAAPLSKFCPLVTATRQETLRTANISSTFRRIVVDIFVFFSVGFFFLSLPGNRSIDLCCKRFRSNRQSAEMILRFFWSVNSNARRENVSGNVINILRSTFSSIPSLFLLLYFSLLLEIGRAHV